jgi:malate dehydrogenase (oxaloacetate-decarboxylating)(NADP+)
MVAVITNGTAVLGLGDIGPVASKPVMEGKAVLFKKFADIDVFDLEVDATDPDRFVDVVAALEPTFGGINLEDIKAPECFIIEDALKQKMNIPVFHDDQHGTAIIVAAAIVNGMATGRSDYPNQVNNVLGFPFIFRGALDVHARKINEEMKLAACKALAELAREDVPDSVLKAYGVKSLRFGRDYIIPKPFDPRVLTSESSAVAEAAVATGVARKPIEDFDTYRERLAGSLSRKAQFMQSIRHRARGAGKRIIFADGDHPTIIRAVNIIQAEDLAVPVLVGRPELIENTARELGIELNGIEIIDPETHPKREELINAFHHKRERRGSNLNDTRYLTRIPDRFAALLLEAGEVDGMVCGIGRSHQYVMRALLQVIPLEEKSRWASGMYILLTDREVLFLADCTAQVEPTAEMLADTALRAARAARYFAQTPRVAMLSFSNFGSSDHAEAQRVRRATELVRTADPDLCVDGELQVDTALLPDMQREHFPFTNLCGAANVLIFPSLSSGLLSAKLLVTMSDAEAIGPLTTGFSKPVNVLHLSTTVEHVVSAAAITAIEAIDGTI